MTGGDARLRQYPDLRPSTPRECRQIIDYALAYQGPVYIRLDGKALPELLDESYRFVPGAVLTLREGEDVALVATGSTVHEVVEAAQQLADLGIRAKVVSVPSIRPAIPRRCWRCSSHVVR